MEKEVEKENEEEEEEVKEKEGGKVEEGKEEEEGEGEKEGGRRRRGDKVSNLKYESVHIDSKAVVFIRSNPGKKDTTERVGLHTFSFEISALFQKC